ncbi:MAG: single-stranded DNA-binding protein [Clostridia bacterium]|nr:single-stranded DNA-binding protein [Clostridia bacterium]
MASFNKVILIGNLTADPELKQTPNGISVTTFSIAVSRRYASRNSENTQQADFITIVAWRNTAEFITKYFQKGKSILIVGSLQSRSWTDQNGQKRYATEVVADEAQFVERKSDGSAPVAGATPAPYGAGPKDVAFEEMSTDDDLPF